MPHYTCSNGGCDTAGATFALTSAGVTFCPHCGSSGTLVPASAPVAAPVSQTRVITTSNAMDKVGSDASEVETLIAKWELNILSDNEAKTTHDCVYKIGKERSKRIDREGPVTTRGVVTHAKFRLQFGSKTYAGVWIKVNQVHDAATIRQAFRESVTNGRYVEVVTE